MTGGPRRIARLLGALALTFSAAAAAQDAGLPAARAFELLDRDRDGAVSRAEFARAREADFGRIDLDRDGAVTRPEFVDRRLPQSDLPSARVDSQRRTLETRFAAIDANGDGRMTLAEYTAYGLQVFLRLDRDGDGRVTRTEFLDPVGAAARPADPGARVFGLLDRDGDGLIAREEMDAARTAAFERLDADRDGALSGREFAARNPAAGDAIVPPELQGRRAPDPRFVQLDGNGDGRVTLEEYLADGHDRFARADRNRDGRLSRAEFDGLDQ